MKPRNAEGTPVDPVPFLVVATLSFLVSLAFGPLYCLALGLGLPAAVAVSLSVFLATTGVAYYRMVWTARPDLRGEVPAAQRLLRLVYAAAIGVFLIFLLSLPLMVG